MVGLPGPALLVSATVLPPTGWFSASLRVAVMVDVVVPSAGTDVGAAATEELAGITGPVVNVTVAICGITTLSVVSVAWKASVPTVSDFTVKVTTPLLLELPDAALITAVPGPEAWASVTVLPLTGPPAWSFSVTVIVDWAVPSAVTDPGLEVTVLLV